MVNVLPFHKHQHLKDDANSNGFAVSTESDQVMSLKKKFNELL